VVQVHALLPTLHNLTRTLSVYLPGRDVGANVGPSVARKVGAKVGAKVGLNVGCGVGLSVGLKVGTGWQEDTACESQGCSDYSVRHYRITDMHSKDKGQISSPEKTYQIELRSVEREHW
jgi:hypothetical protein